MQDTLVPFRKYEWCPETFAAFLFRGKERYQKIKDFKRKTLEALGPNDPRVYEFSRDQNYAETTRKVKLLREALGGRTQFEQPEQPLQELMTSLNFAVHGSIGTFMGIATLRNLGTDEQISLIEPRLMNHIWISCFIQTELATGNDVQNLQTYAVFDEKEQNFVFHTPNVASVKWWVGDLGCSSTHGFVVARLLSQGKDHGVQTFFVEIRDPTTFQTKQGVEIGDIGPKLGFHSRDNGFIKFTNYKVPKSALLSRYINISADGAVKRVGNPKRMYTGMMYMRSVLLIVSYADLFRGCTIATRYSLFRSQFKNSKGEPIKVYDYQLQRDKLFKEIGKCYLMNFATQQVMKTMEINEAKAKQDDFSLLQETHVLLCAGKALFTTWATDGVSNLMKACGGHGFSYYSGLPFLFVEGWPNQIVEGENSILLLQVSRHVMKCFNLIQKGKVDKVEPRFRFLGDASVEESELTSISLQSLTTLLKKAAIVQSRLAAGKFMAGMQKTGEPMDAWNFTVGPAMVNLAVTVGLALSFELASETLKSVPQMGPLPQIIEQVLLLAIINACSDSCSLLLQAEVLNGAQLNEMIAKKEELLDTLKPYGLMLAEGMQWEDGFLASAIGSQDKDPYQTLFSWASTLGKLNQVQPNPAVVQNYLAYSKNQQAKLDQRL